ncbi:hypothetical protein CC78DRAFT_567894 [Lojkania enalia]|uniref:Erythromycin esterase n=1 Tax=Lojkania enalia TaxID=147567 RepID=A0A9P4N6M0_9PLEO|nr:hypothetical protein CC78DRAFT_567894 [Didymosphaeria enalia]
MARRSARLQKRSPTPSSEANTSWVRANSEPSPPPHPERLPSVVESEDPDMKTPQKPTVESPKPAQLPQLSSTLTPPRSKSSQSFLTAITARTPKNRTPIKPAGEEMHPALHHASTAKVLDEARWLGFQALGAHTAPPKAPNGIATGQVTPSKSPVPSSTKKLSTLIPSPEFKFRFKSPIGGLSPQSSRILKQHSGENMTPSRAIFGANEFTTLADVSPERKIAQPKSVSSRFSDVHKAQFKKMDSIANHPSTFRADPGRFKVISASLKRSPSKAEFDKPGSTIKEPATPLKRTQSNIDVNEPTTRIVPNSLKRTQSKMDMGQPSSLHRSQATVRMVPPSRDGRPLTQDGNNTPAKRVKRNATDDAASSRLTSRDGKPESGKTATPARLLHSKASLPRSTARLMTPTKASLARSQSVKTMKSTSMLPSLLRSPTARTLFSPTNISDTMMGGVREGIRKTSDSLNKFKSILRSPNHKFSKDPEKIAAGTHMSPLPGLNMNKALPNIPTTAPARKHVNFSTSTLDKAAQDELGKSPSPIKTRAGSEAPTGTVVYPVLHPSVEYPTLPEDDQTPIGTPSRRLTFGGTNANVPGQFSFKSDKSIKLDLASTSTIRMVRKSNASSLVEGKKRKMEETDESSDKENTQPRECHPPKKMKTATVETPKKTSAASKLPCRTPRSAISKSRLAFLATPKRGKV